MKRVLTILLLPLLLLGVGGCTFFGLLGPKGPHTVTLIYSNETVGELKPCG